ncbi:diguanylate cyclase domain-containing protein [Actinoplanes sp. CA-030573]|uniref:diguanylate cyclase domain-containing protein n=1 Tax=Actinoplanes sp. CA-030573 TaxID=3239898 RepID=UPI003D91407E
MSPRVSWLRRLAPPRQLGGRIRWLFLIFATFNVAGSVPRTLHGTASTPVRIAAVAAAVLLAWWWLRGYRRMAFPVAAIPLEGLAIAAIGCGSRDWVFSTGLLFATVSFRGLFGTWRHVLAVTLVAFAGSLGAVALTDSADVTAFLQQAPGVPPLALFTAVVARTTRRQEEGAARERVFARLGTTLLTSGDAETICRHSAEAAHELLGDVPGGWSAVTLAGPEGDVVTTGAGNVPVELLGATAGEAGVIAGALQTIPLSTEKRRYGALVVGGTRELPVDVRPSLEALAAQTALGLVNVEYAATLHHQAFHDHLTGLANRAQLRSRLEEALLRARRGSHVAVMLIDLDGFKQVNDTYGHAAGDQLLVTVAQRLRDGVRGADTAARLGGDEFAVLLDGMDAPEDAVTVAERLLVALQEPLTVGGAEIRPGGSIGVAIWRGHADIDALLHQADTAMYAAKSAGKGRVAHATADGAVHMLTAA